MEKTDSYHRFWSYDSVECEWWVETFTIRMDIGPLSLGAINETRVVLPERSRQTKRPAGRRFRKCPLRFVTASPVASGVVLGIDSTQISRY